MAEALEWVAKITTVGVEMALFAVAGGWAARRFGMPGLALAGVILGVAIGLSHLLLLTGVVGKRSRSNRGEEEKADP